MEKDTDRLPGSPLDITPLRTPVNCMRGSKRTPEGRRDRADLSGVQVEK
jgi:hypothetical protein